jgi:hypothetical protein
MIGIEPAQEPLDRKIFNQHYDNFLNTGMLNPDIFPLMDSYQQYAVNELKKAFKRLKNETR